MHKIKIDNLEVFAFHGLYDAEKEEGQSFYIDLEYIPKENLNLIDDDISKVTDYMNVLSHLTDLFNKKRYSLIEVLGRELINELIVIYDFIYVKIRIRKKNILGIHKLDYISVEIEKNNE